STRAHTRLALTDPLRNQGNIRTYGTAVAIATPSRPIAGARARASTRLPAPTAPAQRARLAGRPAPITTPASTPLQPFTSQCASIDRQSTRLNSSQVGSSY